MPWSERACGGYCVSMRRTRKLTCGHATPLTSVDMTHGALWVTARASFDCWNDQCSMTEAGEGMSADSDGKRHYWVLGCWPQRFA